MIKSNELIFARINKDVKLPTKSHENAGYDIYVYSDEEAITIPPHKTKMLPTGLYSACHPDYYIQLVERGSTGSKGIAQRCGCIDSGYRGEWFVPVTNTNSIPVIITSDVEETQILEDIILYPKTKAICQAVILPVPKMDVKEVSVSELKNIPSERGIGSLGSSGK